MEEALFPSNIYCEICGALIDRSRPYALCDECVRKMHWITGRTCEKCGKALPETYRGRLCYDCIETEHVFIRGWSCLTYGLYERQIMMGIKYSRRGYMARKMGDVLFDRMEMLIAKAEEAGIQPFETVIPVPVSKGRLAVRGYNQSELMAGQMVRRWKAAGKFPAGLETDVLVRQKETEMLRSLNPEERKLALDGAFGVKCGMEKKITGRTILLVDDIYTTGATADACSNALLRAGAEGVYLLTLCSGGNRKPGEC